MSFYTSLTGLNAATAQLAVTSNNIANVGTTGFKRSRADFGDIFATSPLQKASSVVGQGVALKAVTQEFSQGNVQFSARDRKSTRLNSSHVSESRMPSSA